jgi:predicted lipid-binding transport protein (Tim44 family)
MSDPTLIIFALLAIFVIWKLRTVLGTRTGHERPPYNPFSLAPEQDKNSASGDKDSNVIRMPLSEPAKTLPFEARTEDSHPWLTFTTRGSKVWLGFETIARTEKLFSPAMFIDGAKSAYEMIVLAFATGDKPTLKNLLGSDVFDSFSKAIDQRAAAGLVTETTFVSIDKALFEDVTVRGNLAQITIQFSSKLITATKDPSGSFIDGHPEKIVDMIDIWTFSRDLGSRNPNWILVATDSGH